jgi:zinc/manganese transport system substrate-binding protein
MKMLLKQMKWKIFLLALALSWQPASLVFAQQIRAVASWPALADITRQIGKELVNVESLASGVEDAHGVPMKPSFVPRMNRAEVLILIGLDDEHSWIPALLEVAGNPKILPGQPGYIDCSVGIPVLEAPGRLDRAEGDIHPKGNPHYLSDPVRTKTCARNIATGLIRNFPQHQAAFEKKPKCVSGGTRQLDWPLGENGCAVAGRQICGVPSRMGLSGRSVRYEADRQC